MFKSAALVLLVTATLSLFAFAHPSPRPRSGKTITTIPLPKRSGLTRSDGVFDYAKAVRSIAAAKNKHRRNMINFERNKGRDAFLVVPSAIASFSSSSNTFLTRVRKSSPSLLQVLLLTLPVPFLLGERALNRSQTRNKIRNGPVLFLSAHRINPLLWILIQAPLTFGSLQPNARRLSVN